jgi:hypothetical protein
MHFELGQVGEVIRIVGWLDEHGLAVVPTLDDVVWVAGDADAGLAGHRGSSD